MGFIWGKIFREKIILEEAHGCDRVECSLPCPGPRSRGENQREHTAAYTGMNAKNHK